MTPQEIVVALLLGISVAVLARRGWRALAGTGGGCGSGCGGCSAKVPPREEAVPGRISLGMAERR